MNLITKLCLNQRVFLNVTVRKLSLLPIIAGRRWYQIGMILLLGLTLNHRVQACSLQFTYPARGSTISTAQVGVSGTGSGTANSGDQGQVTAYINGVPFFSQSGTFTTLINFLGSGAASVTLQKGANTLSVVGSVNGCSASDSMVVYYHPAPSTEQKNAGEPEICNGTNPVNDATGNKFQQELDYQGDGQFPLQFIRYYNSAYSDVRALGKSWRHNYEGELYFNSAKTEAYIIRPNGKAYRFTKSGSIWGAEGDINDRFTAIVNSSGSVTGWRLFKSEDNSFQYYDTNGRLITLVDRGGMSQDLSYDASGRLSSVTDRASQRAMIFGYDSKNRLATVSDPIGNVYTYGYDATGRLVQVTPPDAMPGSPGRQYLYNEQANTSNTNLPYALTGILDENGSRYATYRYDTQGRGIATEHAGGNDLHQLTYNADGSTTITDALGQQRTFLHQTVLGFKHSVGQSQPAGAGCAASASSFTYDANGNVASRTDFNGNLSCYTYDLSRNLETIRIEGLAPGANCPSDLVAYTPADGERKTATEWHADYRLPLQIDKAGRSTAFSYDPNGNLLIKTVTDTATGQSRSWTYTYNNLGQMLTADGPRTDVNDVTTYAYYTDTSANHHIGDLYTVTNALGHVTTFTDYDANGRLLSMNDPNGLVVGFAYDARGRLTQKTVDGHTTVYKYDPVGNLIKVTRPSGVYFTYTYDAAHRLTDINDALGGRIHYTLDAMGNRTREDILDADGNVVKTKSRVYDALNRLAQDIGAYNQTTSYEYDANGNLTKITDPNSHATGHQYDTLDRLIRSTDAMNGQTDYQYDALDRLTQVTDANNHSTVYSYNGLGDLLQLVSPNTGTTQYGYDNAGNLAQKTDAGGVTSTYQYDALNRPIGIDYPGTEADVTNSYDGIAQGLGGQIGWLTSARRGTIDTMQQFDLRGNLLFSEVSEYQSYIKNILSDTRYIYNADDQVSETQIRGGLSSFTVRSFKNLYDGAGRVQEVQLSETGANGSSSRVVAENIVHLPFGPVKSLDYGNGLSMSRSYDADYRLAAETAGNVFMQSYQYDQAGNVISQGDGTGAAKQESYGYDELDRLASALGTNLGYQSHNYGYDAVGNRTSLDADTEHKVYQYDLSNQQLQNVTSGSSSIQYQSNSQGNILQIGSRSLHYAPDQRLSDITASVNGAGLYVYDAFGRRIRKISPFNFDMMSYDADNRLLMEWGLLGATLHNYGNVSYAYLDGEPLARVDEPSGGDSQIRYYHNNHLGAPLKVTDQQSQVVWSADYDPFGKATVTNTTITQNLRLPGQYFDVESGWHYNFERYYDPALGRYLQSDPIGLSGGINTYSYVSNNPLNYTDSSGLIIDTLADIGFIAYDLYKLATDGACERNSNLTALGLDFIGAITPGVTGLGTASRVSNSANAFSKVAPATAKQLQKKFKHAEDFGVSGNYNTANAKKFNEAIQGHLNSSGVKEISGSYRGNPVTFHTNPNTGLTVIQNPNGSFLSGWKLNPQQLQHVLKDGKL
jgi:RHS repeat-associated protein